MTHDEGRQAMIELETAGRRSAGTPTIDLSAALVRMEHRPDLMFALLDAMPVAAFWKDRGGRYLGANQYLLDWLEMESRAEIIGRRVHDLVPGEEADRYHADDRAVLEAGAEIHDQHELRTRPDGRMDLVRTTKLPIHDADGEVIGLMGYHTEVTDKGLSGPVDAEVRRRRLAIDDAVRAMEFALHYQPIFDARTGRLRSVEALLRWDDGAGTLRTPADFLPYLELTGMIRQVGLWAVDEASRQLAEWKARHGKAHDLTMAVNISRVQFESDTLVDDVTERVVGHGLDPASMVLEITETAASSAAVDIVSKLLAFRERGFVLAVDDFGVGQSSLSVLCDLPIEIVKIDRSFIASPYDPDAGARMVRKSARDQVLKSVVALVRNLGLKTTVEGVETQAQHDRLRAMGCDLLQGYWRSGPLPASQIF